MSGGVLDGFETGDEGCKGLDVCRAGGVFEEVEERVEGALMGVEDGLVVRLDGDGVHVNPLRYIYKWTIVDEAYSICLDNAR